MAFKCLWDKKHQALVLVLGPITLGGGLTRLLNREPPDKRAAIQPTPPRHDPGGAETSTIAPLHPMPRATLDRSMR